MAKTPQQTIAVDLDGVLAVYDKWRGCHHIGEPYPHARALMFALRDLHLHVIIHTTRGTAEVRAWLEKHHLLEFVHDINCNSQISGNNSGKPIANFYLDDRAIQFNGDVADVVRAIQNFHPWWKGAPK